MHQGLIDLQAVVRCKMHRTADVYHVRKNIQTRLFKILGLSISSNRSGVIFVKRLASIWTIYLLSLIVMIAVMSWVTYSTLDLEQEERSTTLRAENERLALWRIESALLPLILEESSRDLDQWWLPESIALPPLPYSDGTVSELATFDSPFVALHFQVDSHGYFVSPQVPGETLTSELLALDQITSEQLAEDQALFRELKSTTTALQLFDAMQKFQPNVARFGPPELLAEEIPKSRELSDSLEADDMPDQPRLSVSNAAANSDLSAVDLPQSRITAKASELSDPFDSNAQIAEPAFVVPQQASQPYDLDVVQRLMVSHSREAKRRIPLRPNVDDLQIQPHSLFDNLESLSNRVAELQTPLQLPEPVAERTVLVRRPQSPALPFETQELKSTVSKPESKQLDRFQQQAARPGASDVSTRPVFDQPVQVNASGDSQTASGNRLVTQSGVSQTIAGNDLNSQPRTSSRTANAPQDLEPQLAQGQPQQRQSGQRLQSPDRNPVGIANTTIAQGRASVQTSEQLPQQTDQIENRLNERTPQTQSSPIQRGPGNLQVPNQSFSGMIGDEQPATRPGSSANLPGMRMRRPMPQNLNRPFNPLANQPANADLFNLDNGPQGKVNLENVHNYALNVYNRGKNGKAKTNKIAQQQATKSVNELQQRMNNSVGRNGNFVSRFVSDNNQEPIPFSIPSIDGGVAIGPMTSFWLNDRLFPARKVVSREGEFLQGCLLHWPAINRWLKSTVVDLLPNAKLSVTPAQLIPNHLSLATLPIQLLPGEIAVQPMPFLSPIRSSLAMAWVWLSLSAAAIGVLLYGVVRLSERRAAFVFAVTHELRTPLTTFQLYADLLSNRETLSNEKHEQYVGTLRNEAERLGHLVENVLSWSRLERKNDKEANVARLGAT